MAPSAHAETPKDVLVIGHVAELQTLDPAQAVTISDFRILCNMYDRDLGSQVATEILVPSWLMNLMPSLPKTPVVSIAMVTKWY